MLRVDIKFAKDDKADAIGVSKRNIDIKKDNEELYLPDLSTAELIYLSNEITNLNVSITRIIRERFNKSQNNQSL